MGVGREGMRVKMEPIDGITARGVFPSSFGFYFQCPPLEEFGPEYAHPFTDYDTVGAGQMSRKGSGPQLITVSFDTLAVDWGTYTVLDERVDPEDFKARLLRVLEAGTPFLFTAAHQMPPGGYQNWSLTIAGPEIQMPATLRSMKATEKAGEGDARYFSLAFTEYRDPLVDRRVPGKRTVRRPERDLPLTGWLTKEGYFRYHSKSQRGLRVEVRGELHTAGDPVPFAVTLSDLARYFYGDPSLAQKIAKENRISWGSRDVLIRHEKYRDRGAPKVRIPRK